MFFLHFYSQLIDIHITVIVIIIIITIWIWNSKKNIPEGKTVLNNREHMHICLHRKKIINVNVCHLVKCKLSPLLPCFYFLQVTIWNINISLSLYLSIFFLFTAYCC